MKTEQYNHKDIFLGESPAFLTVLETATKLRGHHKANILITGESGTGKEMLARFIHSLEENLERPFVAINCAAIPENLIESELFGHEKGAFTGAIERKIGKFELANRGDIFLDEIGTLKPPLQAKLLRVLQDRFIQRLGGKDFFQLEFRVIAATNENVGNLITSSAFREDLYHRLAVVEITMPSLNQRRDDIPPLVKHFLNKYAKSGKEKQVSGPLMAYLCKREWPGNIRELENLIHNLTIMTEGDTIDIKDLTQRLGNKNSPHQDRIKIVDEVDPTLAINPLEEHLEAAKENYVLDVLDQTGWDLTEAAALLQIGRSTLHTYLKTLNLEMETFT